MAWEQPPTERYPTAPERLEAHDEEIFDEFNSFKIDVYDDIAPDPEVLSDQKEAFLAGEIENPHFTYHKNHSKDYRGTEEELLRLKDRVRSDEQFPDAVVRAYEWAINEKIAKLRMLREVSELQEDGDVQSHMRRFQHYAEYVYGSPRQEIFDDLLARIGVDLRAIPDPSDAELSAARTRLLNLVGDRERTLTPPEFRDDEGEVEVKRTITSAEEVAEIFREALDSYGITGWEVVIDENAVNIGVNSSKRVVRVPTDERLKIRTYPLTAEKIKGLIVHEIGTHALREHRGFSSTLKLLSVGLDRYEKDEEGVATYLEQQYTKPRDFSGEEGYLAIGLARGLDGHSPRTFREVFDVLVDYYQVVHQSDKLVARELAWKRCLRTFRGTPGDLPGVVFPKDIFYREGNIMLWKLLGSETATDHDLMRGKYGFNPRHMQILADLEVTDRGLATIERDEERERMSARNAMPPTGADPTAF